jgi:hypothetical protein
MSQPRRLRNHQPVLGGDDGAEAVPLDLKRVIAAGEAISLREHRLREHLSSLTAPLRR